MPIHGSAMDRQCRSLPILFLKRIGDVNPYRSFFKKGSAVPILTDPLRKWFGRCRSFADPFNFNSCRSFTDPFGRSFADLRIGKGSARKDWHRPILLADPLPILGSAKDRPERIGIDRSPILLNDPRIGKRLA